MAVRSLTYLDIPAAKRQETANKVISRLRERLNDPLTTPDQALLLAERVSQLEKWANGTISTNPEGP
jgi:hypothetical protein